ncbi:DUF1501 domain-containing protein [Ramlibacter albus]|uniref:DUF1501 domain-containing protein n=1 Tax=Ramlibacter albus TaxID=2079448 RepID=A0A923M690_9BURK|nr:DUF1501 domain-containing protein [Ramlibacter albus]MBC5764997.1 DUF1501 domain-containing protein [Ramlibacter albus]
MDPHFPTLEPTNASRREFLRKSALLSVAGSATPWALSLAAIGDAAAATATDYKALVCVFLNGGNDYANTVVPYDTASYNLYQGFRPNIALARDTLLPLTPATPLANGRQYALAPRLSALAPLFGAGQLAVLMNIGTLVQPTTKAQYTARSVPLPPKLFSHNDQASYWQSSMAEGAVTGWGGRLGDLFASSNSTSTFTCIGLAGNAVFLSGNAALQYQVTSNGSIPVNGVSSALFGSTACSTALRNLMTGARNHVLENELARVADRSIDANEMVTSALTSSNVATAFPANNTLADQLRLVARLIGARNALGAKRQVFFVSLGGFDNHNALATTHPNLLGNVGGAMAAFQQAMAELGVARQVTTFTASDFGRTLVSNSDGSDHGWGGFHFVMGGSVAGGTFIGTPPAVANNGADDVGQGRLLPSLSVDQLAGTLASWFGASDTEVNDVVPNLSKFGTRTLPVFA